MKLLQIFHSGKPPTANANANANVSAARNEGQPGGWAVTDSPIELVAIDDVTLALIENGDQQKARDRYNALVARPDPHAPAYRMKVSYYGLMAHDPDYAVASVEQLEEMKQVLRQYSSSGYSRFRHAAFRYLESLARHGQGWAAYWLWRIGYHRDRLGWKAGTPVDPHILLGYLKNARSDLELARQGTVQFESEIVNRSHSAFIASLTNDNLAPGSFSRLKDLVTIHSAAGLKVYELYREQNRFFRRFYPNSPSVTITQADVVEALNGAAVLNPPYGTVGNVLRELKVHPDWRRLFSTKSVGLA